MTSNKIEIIRPYLLREDNAGTIKNTAILFLIIVFLTSVTAASDVVVWKGQYYTGTDFNKGTYVFNFSVYDSLTGGSLCYSNTTTLTTGNWGEWKTEQYGVSSSCNNVSRDYFLEISINGTSELPRRRLTMFNFLRKDANEVISGDITINGKIRGGSPLRIDDDLEANSIFSKGNVEVSGDIEGNFYYGEMYVYNHSDLINIVFPKKWYNLTNFTGGHSNGFSYLNSTLTTFSEGVYRIEYNVVYEGIKNNIYYFAPTLNNQIQSHCRIGVFTIKTGSLVLASNSCYVRLSSGDRLGLMVSNYLATGDVSIDEANFNVFRIGN